MPQTTYKLTPVQETVLAAILGGATMKAAAEAAAIHRNTVSYWRRTSLPFRDALCQAHYDKAIFVREEAEIHVADAFAVIHAILTKPDASDAARLNAAKYIIDKASTPPPPVAPQPEIVNSPAQIRFESQTPEPAPELPELKNDSKTVHSNAQSPHKIGRNAPCPCGSHLKFKRCCLGKPHLARAA